MANYELVVIWDPYMSDDDYKLQVEKGKDRIARNGGQNIVADVWGRRVMAYPINKKPEGYYVVFTFEGKLANEQLQDIERNFRLNETIMREMLVLVPVVKPAKPAKVRKPAAARRRPYNQGEEGDNRQFSVRSAGDAGSDNL
jgi:small subunit ribosomal protein S6